jgi:chloride channel protein, CIC family
VISEVVIGMGASIGREAALKLLGGASGSVLAGWGGLSVQQWRLLLLVACGGGAGFAAVYNVPLAGALFTAEILIGSISLPVVLPAVVCAWIATATAWVPRRRVLHLLRPAADGHRGQRTRRTPGQPGGPSA